MWNKQYTVLRIAIQIMFSNAFIGWATKDAAWTWRDRGWVESITTHSGGAGARNRGLSGGPQIHRAGKSDPQIVHGHHARWGRGCDVSL